MNFQPRGYKRKPSYASLLYSIRREVEKLAVRFNCSKSYVIATLLSKQLGIHEQDGFDEITKGTESRPRKTRRYRKAKRVKSRNGNVAKDNRPTVH